MRTIRALGELKEVISLQRNNGLSIGFVPTMGALHEGHLSLVEKSLKENQFTVVSIFINPLQFDNPVDLEKYPRVLSEDIQLLEANNVDVLFMPSEDEFYPEKPLVSIDFGKMASGLEGQYRPGHFEGVGIVVSKLLHVVSPDKAYFGLKDLQQFVLIRRMCEDLNFTCKIVGVETVREPSGLAMSSRNRRLSSKGLESAAIIHKGLEELKQGVLAKKPLKELIEQCRNTYQSEKSFELEYLESVDPSDLSPVQDYTSLSELAVCVAGYVDGIRLIDNLYLRLKE